MPFRGKLEYLGYQFSSVQFSPVTQSCLTLWPHETAVPQTCLSITTSQHLLRLISIELVMSSKHLIFCQSLSSCISLSQHQDLFQRVSSSHQVAKLLALQFQHQSFQWIFRNDYLYYWLVGSPCNPRDSQESSPTPQFKSINYLVLSILYGPTLTPVHGYWKSHSFD